MEQDAVNKQYKVVESKIEARSNYRSRVVGQVLDLLAKSLKTTNTSANSFIVNNDLYSTESIVLQDDDNVFELSLSIRTKTPVS